MAKSPSGDTPLSSATTRTDTTRSTADQTESWAEGVQQKAPASKAQRLAHKAELFRKQAAKLSHHHPSASHTDVADRASTSSDRGAASSIKSSKSGSSSSSIAVEARFVTPHDPVIITSDGNRLPGVPLQEAHKLNVLREDLETGERDETVRAKIGGDGSSDQERTEHDDDQKNGDGQDSEGNGGDGDSDEPNKVIEQAQKHKHGLAVQQQAEGGTLGKTKPPSHTNPLFPPLPLYGPPSRLRDLQCLFFRISSFFLSLAFLGVIVLGALFTSVPLVFDNLSHRLKGQEPDEKRPFYEEEKRRAKERQEKEHAWQRQRKMSSASIVSNGSDEECAIEDEFPPTEGGKDPIVCDIGYYARRVGLDAETFHVQTEDGFIIDLYHIYDPREHTPRDDGERDHLGPDPSEFTDNDKHHPRSSPHGNDGSGSDQKRRPKFPVLLMHGLLQSAGAYCCNDDSSLAFWLCKSGYDVWLGANRCGFTPRHALLEYSDPRMWCWNIRQMGVFDLPALTARVLRETGFAKIGLIAHSQGTTQTLVALAKEQRPDIGSKLTVFCGLAPAAYAGPLIGKMYFKFMRIITPAMFRLVFGIHAFIPLMLRMHGLLPPRIYGWLGYKVFSFLFSWTDTRWDRRLRDRMFQFSPVYVSAESMRWWLGRECFAKHKCILATRDAVRAEEREMADEDGETTGTQTQAGTPISSSNSYTSSTSTSSTSSSDSSSSSPGSTAWYDERAPPFAFWVCGSDDLVDGRRLLRRFETGREPEVRVVHSTVIPEYEHLDVLWAMDAEEKVFRELREVLWKTCDVRDICRVPVGCEHVEPLDG